MKENNKRNIIEKQKRTKALRYMTKSIQKQKTDWAEIVKKCDELGLSYGEATAKGII